MLNSEKLIFAEHGLSPLNVPNPLCLHCSRQAANEGHEDILVFLVEEAAADVNLQAFDGTSALHVAIQTHGEEHPATSYLRSLGALDIGPDPEL